MYILDAAAFCLSDSTVDRASSSIKRCCRLFDMSTSDTRTTQ